MNKIVEDDVEKILSNDLPCDLPWGNFSGKTILITGASGFLPAYLVHTILRLNALKMLAKPARVLAMVRNEEKAKNTFSEYLYREDFNLIAQDVTNPSTEKLNEDIHYIIHAASQASPKYYGTDPVGTLSANILGAVNLLKLAQHNPIESFLYFSSGEVYGRVMNDVNLINETDYGYIDPLNVRSCYAESKRMTETICVAWQKQFKVPVKIVRPFHTYGPGMQLNDGRVFADFVADIVNNQHIVMKSDGSAIRAFCYLSDATLGFFTVLFKGAASEAYNVGNPKEAVSILELAEILISLFPEKKLKIIKNHERRNENYLNSPIPQNVPDISKLQHIGWEPQYSISEGFQRTIRSYTAP